MQKNNTICDFILIQNKKYFINYSKLSRQDLKQAKPKYVALAKLILPFKSKMKNEYKKNMAEICKI